MERSGLSRGFIAKSILRLETHGLLTINHSNREGRCNQYKFKELERFEKVPYALFENQELTSYEKAMLICLRQFFNHGSLTTSYPLKKLAGYLGLSYSQVYKPYKSLIKKGFITEKTIISKHTQSSWTKAFFTSKIDWLYLYTQPKKEVQEFKIIVGPSLSQAS